MLLINPAPATLAQDFRNQGTYVIPAGAPSVVASYPDSTQSVVDGIVTNAFTAQRGTSGGSGATVSTPSWKRKDCARPRRRRRGSTDTTVPAQTLVKDTATVPSPVSGVPWWLIGLGAFVLLVGLPRGGGAR